MGDRIGQRKVAPQFIGESHPGQLRPHRRETLSRFPHAERNRGDPRVGSLGPGQPRRPGPCSDGTQRRDQEKQRPTARRRQPADFWIFAEGAAIALSTIDVRSARIFMPLKARISSP